MTAVEIQKAAREAAERTAAAQGLPARVADQRVLAQVAVVLGADPAASSATKPAGLVSMRGRAVTGLIVLALDRDVAGHLAVALRRHRGSLLKNGYAEPEALAELQEMAMAVSNVQQASGNVNDIGGAEDGLHERQYLSRTDIHRISGASVSTIDRWIRSGKLPSCKRGRTRRIARTDLNRFLAAA